MVLAPRNIIAVVTRCSDQRCHLKIGTVVKLFNYISVEALVNIRSLYLHMSVVVGCFNVHCTCLEYS
mgnify:CR=1 FL=1